MVIERIDFPIYATFLLLSFLFNIVFHYYYLKKYGMSKEHIGLFLIMSFAFCIIGAKVMTMIVNKDFQFRLLTTGFSSYGGAIGILLSSYLFSKMISNNLVIKSSILSLPLMYAISKLGCFFAGCCYGIPYDGLFHVTYLHGRNISLFPVQLVESVLFFFIFLVGIRYIKKKYILEVIVILSASTKFLLEYFRYENMGKFICINQIVSLLLIGFALISIFIKKKSYTQ